MTKHADQSTDIAFTTPVFSVFVPLALCFMGYLFAGCVGLAIGMAIAIVLALAGAVLDGRRRPGFTLRAASATRTSLVAAGKGLVMAGAAAMTLIIAAVLIIGGWFVILVLNLTAPLRRRLPRTLPTIAVKLPSPNWRSLWADFSRADNLALFILNMLMLLALACIFIGMQVALYVAIVLTPIWLMGLILLAIQGNDPNFQFDDEPVPGGHE